MKTFLITLFFSLNAFAAQSGIFMVVVGKVFIEKTSGELTKAKISSVVHPGEAVITDAASRAKIVMSDRNIINVLPSTKFVFEKYENEPGNKNVDLKLEKGRIRADVEEKYDGKDTKFEIRTAVSVAGVRGTQFVVSHNDSKNVSEVITLDGEVSVQRVGSLSGALGFGKNGQVIVKVQERLQVSAHSKTANVEKLQSKAFEDLKKETSVSAEVKEKSSRTN